MFLPNYKIHNIGMVICNKPNIKHTSKEKGHGFSVKNIAGCTGKRVTGPLRQYLRHFPCTI
jgi:hypothetical protein